MSAAAKLPARPVSLSVVIPCYNEALNVADTVGAVTRSLDSAGIREYEIVIINDCSKDDTGKIADSLSRANPRVKVLHNPHNLGFGGSYLKGLASALCDYVVMIPGDNEIAEESILNVIGAAGEADIIVPYTSNHQDRPLMRQIVSHTFTAGMNFLFGMKLKYFNGICLFHREMIIEARVTSTGFAYMAQALVRLIKLQGATYREVEMRVIQSDKQKTKAFSLKNIYSVLSTIVKLWVEVRWTLLKRVFSKGAQP